MAIAFIYAGKVYNPNGKEVKTMKKTIILVLAISLIIAGVAMASVVSSKHDMRDVNAVRTLLPGDIVAVGSTTSQVCVFCHHPHRGASTVTNTLLWNINSPGSGSYAVYANTSTLEYASHNAGYTVGTDNAEAARYTLLCLGCHDGTTAMTVGTGASFVRQIVADGTLGSFPDLTASTEGADLGQTLADDHPVDFTYPQATIAPDADINISTNGGVSVLGQAESPTVTYPLFSGTMQCATCHDVHNGSSFKVQFMRAYETGTNNEVDIISNSRICRDCHTHK